MKKNVLIEAQTIPEKNRRDVIFNAFNLLASGESISILNNHDPKSLLMQFNENYPGQFISEYLLNGPTEWKIKLTKKMKEGCCGCC